MSVNEKAMLLVESVTKALASGSRHYDPETNELLSDAKAVLTCLRDKGTVVVQEPRRCSCGYREYDESKMLCSECLCGLPRRST